MSIRIPLIVALLMASSGGSDRAAADHLGKTLGPPGGFIDRDYRIDVTWIDPAAPAAADGAPSADAGRGPGDYARMLSHGGWDRHYEVHVPPGYRPGSPAPVVMVLHGGGGFPSAVRYQSGMDAVADREGFLVVYPAGTGYWYEDRLLHWNAGGVFKNKAQQSVDDVAFLTTVLDDVASMFTIDPTRVYATGISNGAHMCYRLASEASDRFAAIGPIAGQRTVGQLVGKPPRPVPLIHFHGKQDTWAPFDGGTSGSFSAFEPYQFPPVEQAIASWVAFNRCDPKPSEKVIGEATCLNYSAGPGGAEVELWVLANGGHTWPGGKRTKAEERGGVGEVNHDIDASQEMWSFFQRQRLPTP